MYKNLFVRAIEGALAHRGAVLGGAVLLVCVWAAIAGPRGLRVLLEKREEIRRLQEENAGLAAENQRRRERIQRLEESRAEQEMEIRKNLKLVRPGETTFILPEGEQPAAAPDPAR